MPSQQLLNLCPLAFAFDMLPQVQAQDGNHPTAEATLSFFQELCVVFLQDAAAMLILGEAEERQLHPIFQEMPIFKLPIFLEFKEEMRLKLETAEDPLDASLEKVMPGVHQRFVANYKATSDLERKFDTRIDQLQQVVVDGFQQLYDNQQEHRMETDKLVGTLLVEAGERLLQNTPPHNNNDSAESTPVHTTTQNTRQRIPVSGEPRGNSNSTGVSRVNGEVAHPELPEAFRNMTNDELLVVHKTYYLKMRHTTLGSFWNEWFGLAEFDDGFAGIEGRNQKHGAQWRKHLPATEYSYRNRLIKGIQATAEEANQQPSAVIEEWEPLFADARFSIGNLVKALQQSNKLPKGKQRGKKKN
ncbi:unknown protein [Seminavis robusta]|uniref:Transcription activator GCR1-like domain-containing protein n=1 Tax=Seminavis robusta TaxID=568900 RepID=A0A9N8I196_9STRA|nr:unknown protein [Seminavis robusta]|eukprot:Sro3286_g346190.1 n/a (358) ;mRNA; f:3246-4319